jgi:hypothetical protein
VVPAAKVPQSGRGGSLNAAVPSDRRGHTVILTMDHCLPGKKVFAQEAKNSRFERLRSR